MLQVVLTPHESRRLIARATVALPEVRKALKDGIVCVARGITNGMIIEEIAGTFQRENYVSGCILPRRLCQGFHEKTLGEITFVRGEMKVVPSKEIIKEMGSEDVFIKGANAIDVYGNAGILVAGEGAGTIGWVIGDIYLKGIRYIIPAGLEKLVAGDITESAPSCGRKRVTYSMGMAVGLFPVSGRIVTEIEAIESVANVTVRHIASGGVCGAEGAVTLAIEGEKGELDKALSAIKLVLGEEPLAVKMHECATCTFKACGWVGQQRYY